MSFSHCYLEARKDLNYFDNEELKNYLGKVMIKAKSYADLKGNAAIDQAIKDVGEESSAYLTQDLQIHMNDKAKLEKPSGDIKNKKYSLFDLLATHVKNLAYNVEAAQKSARNRLSESFFNKLEKEEFDYLLDPNNGLEIARAQDGRSKDKLANGIASKAKNYYLFRNTQMIASDALSIAQLNADRTLKAVHVPQLLANGGIRGSEAFTAYVKRFGKSVDTAQAKQLWKDFILPKINLEKTFRDTEALLEDGTVDLKKVDEILNGIYDNILKDKPEIFARGKGIAKMFFYWNSHEDLFKYTEKYGRKDLFSNFMADINQSGNKIGMAEIMGSQPINTYDKLAVIDNEVNSTKTSKGLRNKQIFNALAGVDQAPVNATIANIGSTIRSLTAIKSLGKVTLASLPDIANGISFAKRWGFDYGEAYTTYLSGLFNALPNDERKYIADVFKMMTDQHMGYISRFVDSNNIPQAVNTASHLFFRSIGLEAFDKGNKVSSLYLLSKSLGKFSKLGWEELPELTKNQMNKFDFTQKEWDLLRSKNEKGLFTTDNVQKITDDELRKAYDLKSSQPLDLIKSDLYRKVYSMFDVWADNTVLKPNVYMRTLMAGGTRSGTIIGEALRTILQFKQYSFLYLNRVLYHGLAEADGAAAKAGFIASLMGATVPMGFMSYYLNNLSKGRSLPSWDQMSINERTKATGEILFPANGLFNNFYDTKVAGRDIITSAFNTPALQELSYALAAPIALAHGDVDKFLKDANKAREGVTPGLSLPFLDPLFRQAFGQKAKLQPGQIQYFGS